VNVGVGIFLVALGAILAFAVSAESDWLRINVVGWVLILTGLVLVTLKLAIWSKRRRGGTVTKRQVYEDGREVKSEQRVYRDTTRAPE